MGTRIGENSSTVPYQIILLSTVVFIEEILCSSHLCTEQLIHISALSKLQESAEISTVRYTNLNGTVPEGSTGRHL